MSMATSDLTGAKRRIVDRLKRVDTSTAPELANEFGLTKKQNLAGLLVFISDVNSLGLPTAKGMYLTTAFYWDRDDDSRAHRGQAELRRDGVGQKVHAWNRHGDVHVHGLLGAQ